MHDALQMGIVEGHGGLAENSEQAVRGERLAGDKLVERGAVDVLHGDVGDVVLRLHIVDGDDARMREDAGRARFAEQALAQAGTLLGVGDFAEADGLDGDRTADGGIGGQVHDAHGAAAQFAHDFVASDAVHQTYSVLCRGPRGLRVARRCRRFCWGRRKPLEATGSDLTEESARPTLEARRNRNRERFAMTYNFKIVVQPDEDFDGHPSGWHAYCPVLERQGASTWAETEDEAIKNINELVRMVVGSMREHGQRIPEEPPDQVEVTVEPRVAVTV